jgi:hypothetical protein
VCNIDRTPLGFEAQPKPLGEPHFVVDHKNAHPPSMKRCC